ncbi:MAG: hypothetical protein J6S96_07885 [Muribaculaceae bacterium]|nr:hypothetical protein [Muribaculaceae bacterium]
MCSEISIDSLLNEGRDLKSSLKLNGEIIGWYSFQNEDKYTKWKYTTIRAIECLFPDDNGISRLEDAFKQFESHLRSPDEFSQILGILESFNTIPKIVPSHKQDNNPVIQVINSQSQFQTQSMQLVVDIINDVLTTSQRKDLKEIIESDTDVESKKKSILEKIKSFGSDVAASILANIVTNPNIIGTLFS